MIRFLGNGEGGPVFEDAATALDREPAGEQQLAIDPELRDAPGMRRQPRDARTYQPIGVAVALLEMLRPEEHAFRPNDLVIVGHGLPRGVDGASPSRSGATHARDPPNSAA